MLDGRILMWQQENVYGMKSSSLWTWAWMAWTLPEDTQKAVGICTSFPLYHSYNHWMLLVYSSVDLASDVDKIDACLQDETWEDVEMVSFVSKHLLYQSARSFIGDDLFQKILSLLAWNPSYLHSTFLFTKLSHIHYLWSFIHPWLFSSPWMRHAFCGTEPSHVLFPLG